MSGKVPVILLSPPANSTELLLHLKKLSNMVQSDLTETLIFFLTSTPAILQLATVSQGHVPPVPLHIYIEEWGT